MNMNMTSHHPLPASPIKGEVKDQRVWQDTAPNSMHHLPLDGGGWEGVAANSNFSIPSLVPGACA